jgi:uncharacterized protein YecE (DUF72 family)
MLPNFISGLSGLALPLPKYQFPAEYQQSSRLTYYASIFSSLEVNSSFYKIPQKRTLEKWALSVPEEFKFTFKLLKDITHCNNLAFERETVVQFIDAISAVGNKRGALLLQFPPSLKSNSINQLDQLLDVVTETDVDGNWKIAVEFRDASWYNDDVYDLLASYNSTLVIQDIPKSATPFTNFDCDFIYVRFHGPTGNYRGSYSAAFLSEFAGYINEWLSDEKKVFTYFNNTAGDAFNNLKEFNKHVADLLQVNHI